MDDETKTLLGKLQMQNQQLQSVLLQKQALSMQHTELERALAELQKATDDVYRSVGSLLIKTDKDAMTKELEEAKEETELKLKAMETQEKRLTEHLRESQKKLQERVPEGIGG